ncbi:hypothetical protein PHYBLDRAFT_163233 [Phycomyces blakesleeanus NRRL 1555(-)]|uniref:Uncharacterized protein n=1 Tax=Phycomyces blakesleeanus (strain ATCC 8743b / DSM 1359 / FGSC 10004 / NBRC 33097 / NRRL 1555) TaxID=763407 RepID=A0A167QSV5_PHYB8|nr:hypothetical protein PHYBLDRAFT_163233 [Phycomyces blakesleeanus NRRL 1555(-)]OAD80200.1 hypothetical protein PHYBLDRAFT_163233 [Phycomyces blakesleeanus NRRL 1555(-)]|eukprot:XP_018298240.1 hypothetical protein PHYBLDRAFT_163233 [Phycomyces blakesleeanus NRRL 1555(-)]
MTSSHKSALGLPTKLAPYRSDTVYPAKLTLHLILMRHLHNNEHPSYKRAIPQELSSHATIIAMIISWSAKKSFAFVKEIIIPCFTVNILFLCLFVLGTSNHNEYIKSATKPYLRNPPFTYTVVFMTLKPSGKNINYAISRYSSTVCPYIHISIFLLFSSVSPCTKVF